MDVSVQPPATAGGSDEKLERAVRLELTNTGFAIRRLSRLATRAEWNGRRDSNSRIEFGRLACFRLHHFRKPLPIANCQFPIGRSSHGTESRLKRKRQIG